MAVRVVLFLWLTLSQIYWMPYIGSTRFISMLLFGLLILFSLFSGSSRFPKGSLFLISSMIFFDIIGSHAAEYSAIFGRIVQYVYLFLLLLIVAMSNIDRQDLNEIFKRVVNLFCIVCLLTLLLQSANPITGNQFLLDGFNFKNNKWSISLALMFAIEYGLFRLYASGWPFFVRVLSILKLIFLASMSIVSFGRGGIIAIILVLVLNTGIRRILPFIVGAISIIVIFAPVIDYEYILKQLLNANDLTNYGVDEISSGRSRQFPLALSEITKNPFGIGWDNVPILFKRELGVDWNLHNMPLRLILESGWLMSVYVLGFYIVLLYQIFKDKERVNGVQRNVLLVGLLVALFEPNYVFGLFQVNAIFWICLIIYTNERKIFTSF